MKIKEDVIHQEINNKELYYVEDIIDGKRVGNLVTETPKSVISSQALTVFQEKKFKQFSKTPAHNA